MQRILVVALVVAGLASPALAQNKKKTFWFSLSETFAIGNARASAFSDSDVRSALEAICPGKAISGFTTTIENGRTRGFSALCNAGYTMTPGTVYVDRTSNGGLRLERLR